VKYYFLTVLALAGLSGIPAGTALQEPVSKTAPLIICADAFADGVYYVQITKANGKLTLSPLQAVDLHGKPVGSGDPEGPTPPDGSSRIGAVQDAMEDIGQLAKFHQQVETLKFSLKIPPSLMTFGVAYNSVNSTLEVVLEEFASPQWDPWLKPFVVAMEAAKGDQDRDALVAAVDEARALLSESD